MMRINACLVLVAAALFGWGVLGDGAQAGRCSPEQPCGEFDQGHGASYKEAQWLPDFGRKKRRPRRMLETPPPPVTNDDLFEDGGYASGTLIPQSVAVTQALAAYPGGKPLGVKLFPGPPPVYAVKLRVDGQVFRVLVDAQSAQILGQ
jgi:hypothetical protein